MKIKAFTLEIAPMISRAQDSKVGAGPVPGMATSVFGTAYTSTESCPIQPPPSD